MRAITSKMWRLSKEKGIDIDRKSTMHELAEILRDVYGLHARAEINICGGWSAAVTKLNAKGIFNQYSAVIVSSNLRLPHNDALEIALNRGLELI